MDWLAPGTADEAADLVRDLADRDGPVLATGAREPPPDVPPASPPPEAVVSTAGLSGVVELRPRDLTVTVGAGTRMADLLDRLDGEGAWIPLAGPALELSAGGAVAAALPGPWDEGHGDLRRQLLACEMVTWSGRRVRWGRGVMKNVAGYGTTRAVAGSFGRLGLVLRATFRLWPAPGTRRVAPLLPARDGDALELAGRIARSDFDAAVRPDAVVWRCAPAGQRLEVRLVGSAPSVELRLERLRSRGADDGFGVGDVSAPGSAAEAAAARASGPLGRGRESNTSAGWIAAGRGGFVDAARAAREALDGDLLGLEGYPLAGALRLAWRPEDGAGDGGTRLPDGPRGRPLRVERGTRRELAAAEERRPEGVRRLERRVAAALGGRPRHWLSGFL